MMNRNRAKLLTLAGMFGCLAALIFLLFNVARTADSYYLPLLLLVGGIVLIVLSLAFYTEK